MLLRKGIRLAWIRGVLLVVSSSYELSIQHTGELMECLEYVGFTISLKGSSPWPTRQATFLGLLLDTESGRVTLSEESWADLGSSLAPFRHEGARVTYHTVSKSSDLWGVAHPVVPLGLLNLKLPQGCSLV